VSEPDKRFSLTSNSKNNSKKLNDSLDTNVEHDYNGKTMFCMKRKTKL
jgi:hypothetical protein